MNLIKNLSLDYSSESLIALYGLAMFMVYLVMYIIMRSISSHSSLKSLIWKQSLIKIKHEINRDYIIFTSILEVHKFSN